MTTLIVETPRGAVFKTGETTSELVWYNRFQPTWQGRYSGAQRFLDRAVLRGNEPFVPKKTGALLKSGELGTVFGNGLVQWLAPYARKNYYSPRPVGSATGPLRGPFWFERWKAASGPAVVEQTKRMMRGGA